MVVALAGAFLLLGGALRPATASAFDIEYYEPVDPAKPDGQAIVRYTSSAGGPVKYRLVPSRFHFDQWVGKVGTAATTTISQLTGLPLNPNGAQVNQALTDAFRGGRNVPGAARRGILGLGQRLGQVGSGLKGLKAFTIQGAAMYALFKVGDGIWGLAFGGSGESEAPAPANCTMTSYSLTPVTKGQLLASANGYLPDGSAATRNLYAYAPSAGWNVGVDGPGCTGGYHDVTYEIDTGSGGGPARQVSTQPKYTVPVPLVAPDGATVYCGGTSSGSHRTCKETVKFFLPLTPAFHQGRPGGGSYEGAPASGSLPTSAPAAGQSPNDLGESALGQQGGPLSQDEQAAVSIIVDNVPMPGHDIGTDANGNPDPSVTPSPDPNATPSPDPTPTPSPDPNATPSPDPTPSSHPGPDDIPGINFAPIMGAVNCDVFPFGVPCWMFDSVSSWVGDATAPVFSLPSPFHDGTIDLDMAVMDPGMPVIRGMLLLLFTVSIWVGIAGRAAGNPGGNKGDDD